MGESKEISKSFVNIIKCLAAISPAFNKCIQMLFILPQKAITLMKMYPDLIEKEELLIDVFGLRYDEYGKIEPRYDLLGASLRNMYHSLFVVLADSKRREELLNLANLNEDEFKEIDPLRAWLEIALEYLAEISKDALRLLDTYVTELLKKETRREYLETYELDRIRKEINADYSIEELLRQFHLLIHGKRDDRFVDFCPLALDVYSDLRIKLKELLK